MDLSSNNPRIRPIHPSELPLLKDFLYEAIFIPEGAEAPARDIVERPELRVYTDDFGSREGDHCLVAEADDGREVEVLTMGPICIAPGLKRQEYGKILLDYSLERAAALGFGAVLFEGDIRFYGKSGFDYARQFGIRYHDLPEGADDSFFLCKELAPGYLDDVAGVYQTPQGYYVKDEDVEAFDREFPPKEKLKLPGQIFE